VPFAGGSEADVCRNRRGGSARRRRQKPRLLPVVAKLMSAEIAAGDFGR
jgi:hypothetical protein